MKNRKIVVASLALALTFATFSISGAQDTTPHHQGSMVINEQMMGMNQMNHCQMAENDQTTPLTPKQQQEVDRITAQYTKEKAALETAITTKRQAMYTAMNSDATTMGSIKGMRQEMMTLHQNLQALQQKINKEISTTIGMNYAANIENCPMQQEQAQTGQMMGSNCMTQMQGRPCRM